MRPPRPCPEDPAARLKRRSDFHAKAGMRGPELFADARMARGPLPSMGRIKS